MGTRCKIRCKQGYETQSSEVVCMASKRWSSNYACQGKLPIKQTQCPCTLSTCLMFWTCSRFNRFALHTNCFLELFYIWNAAKKMFSLLIRASSNGNFQNCGRQWTGFFFGGAIIWLKQCVFMYGCTEVRCPKLNMPVNGGYKCSDGSYFNSRCEFFCAPGFGLKGQKTTTCQHNKAWSAGVPTCVGKSGFPQPDGDSIAFVLQKPL